MLTKVRIRDDLKQAELDWITAVARPGHRRADQPGTIQPTLFDNQDMAEITSPDYPGERLIACYNPFPEAERARKRGELLAATEAELAKISAATRRAHRPLRGKDNIALAVGKVINKKKVAKHFITKITDETLTLRRDEQKIAAEAALDGIYVIRTSLPPKCAGRRHRGRVPQGHGKRGAGLPRAQHRPADPAPIRHRLEERVRVHVLIRTLAYYIAWHMQRRLAPMLLQDHDPATVKAARPSPVAAQRSPAAQAKATAEVTADGQPVHSFATLLADLATITANRIQPSGGPPAFTVITTSTPIQRRAYELPGVSHRHGYA